MTANAHVRQVEDNADQYRTLDCRHRDGATAPDDRHIYPEGYAHDLPSSHMPVDPPFNVYRDQLTSRYHGLALWNPNPHETIYNSVSIGDVGYVREGVFIRMFNVILPWDDESNKTLGEPEPYESLDCGPFTKVLDVPLKTQDHYSRSVSIETNDSNAQARVPDE